MTTFNGSSLSQPSESVAGTNKTACGLRYVHWNAFGPPSPHRFFRVSTRNLNRRVKPRARKNSFAELPRRLATSGAMSSVAK
jgi:hypothetical protein